MLVQLLDVLFKSSHVLLITVTVMLHHFHSLLIRVLFLLGRFVDVTAEVATSA